MALLMVFSIVLLKERSRTDERMQTVSTQQTDGEHSLNETQQGSADNSGKAGEGTDKDTGRGGTAEEGADENQDDVAAQNIDGDETAGAKDDERSDEIEGDGIVHMAFAGDICFHDPYSNMATYVQRGSDITKCISSDLMEEMHAADIFMVNNEFPYSNRGVPVEGKTYTFRSKPENVSILHDMGVDIVSLANNHAYDHGEVALLDTFEVLKEAGVPYVGAGHNIEEARAPYIFDREGVKIAIVSATQIERTDNPDTKGATETTPGTFRCWGNKLQQLLDAAQDAKAQADVVIVYIHWGTENTDVLDWAQLDQAKALAGAGVDLIVGDHPHCLQEIGQINGVPVIYSLGNYWFNSKTVDTGLLKVDVSKNGIEQLQFVPAIQANCTTTMATGPEKERILNYMRSISKTVTLDENGVVKY